MYQVSTQPTSAHFLPCRGDEGEEEEDGGDDEDKEEAPSSFLIEVVKKRIKD